MLFGKRIAMFVNIIEYSVIYIFNVFRYRVLVKMLVDFWSILEAVGRTFSNHFHDHMLKLTFIDF